MKFIIVFCLSIFLFGCVNDASNTKIASNNPTNEVKVDAEELKRKAEAEAKALAEAEAKALAEQEKIAEAKRDSIRKAEKLLAEKKRKAIEKKKREAAKAKELAEAKAAAAAQPKTPPPPPKPKVNKGPKIKFEKTNHNFGNIKEGDVVKHEFFFKNTGNQDLLIMDATATCGCTAPGFSFFPLKPGDESAITVTYNSKNKVGAQKPEITVITNAYPKKYILTLEGTVE